MNRHERDLRQAGMTLVEILVAVGIFGLVAAALTTILFSSSRVGTRTTKRADVQGACRQALSLMTTELRQAGADPSIPPIGVVALMSADSVSVRFRGDFDGNGVIQTTEPSEDVTYAYVDSSGTLTRDPGSGASPVVTHVTDMALTYYDDTNTPITPLPLSSTDRARVRSVGITLTAEEDDSHPITLTTRIMLRNRQ